MPLGIEDTQPLRVLHSSGCAVQPEGWVTTRSIFFQILHTGAGSGTLDFKRRSVS